MEKSIKNIQRNNSMEKKNELILHIEGLPAKAFDDKKKAEAYIKSLHKTHGKDLNYVQMYIVKPYILRKK